jgi:hypothetical protein
VPIEQHGIEEDFLSQGNWHLVVVNSLITRFQTYLAFDWVQQPKRVDQASLVDTIVLMPLSETNSATLLVNPPTKGNDV